MLPPSALSGLNVGEKLVFDAIQDAAGKDDWIAIHSLRQTKVLQKTEAETDFVVLIPNKGMVLVEVKGATSVTVHGENWTMEGVPPGTEHKSPVKQLENAQRNIKSHLRTNDFDANSLPIAKLIWFPKIPVHQFVQQGEAGMSLHLWEVAFNSDLKKAAATIEKALDEQIKEYAANPDIHWKPETFNEEEMGRIENLLIARRSGETNAEIEADILKTELRRATDHVLELLENVQGNDNLYICGPAGTGKSMMLGRAASDLAGHNRRVLITCYSEMVADQYRELYGGHRNIEVMMVADLFLASTANRQHKKTSDKEKYYSEELPGLALGRIKTDPNFDLNFDVICVDEFQDIASKPKVVETLFRYFRDSPDFDPQVILAADDWQQIMNDDDGQDSWGVAKDIFPDLVHIRLVSNVRQSPMLSNSIYEFLEWTKWKPRQNMSKDLPWAFDVVRTKVSQESKDLAKTLRELCERYSPEQIRVLSPRFGGESLLNKVFSSVPENADERWLRKNLRHSSSDGKIRWRSIPKFKGLESDVVVITDINADTELWLQDRGLVLDNMLYVGMTRAKQHVVLLVSDGLYTEAEARAKKLKKHLP